MWGSNHKYKEIIQMSKETKGSENSQSQPRLSNEKCLYKTAKYFKKYRILQKSFIFSLL